MNETNISSYSLDFYQRYILLLPGILFQKSCSKITIVSVTEGAEETYLQC